MTISGCSTLGVDADKIKPLPAASLCPPPSTYASYNTFLAETRIREGETAFQTVKRFRLAEKEKNAAGRRLWSGMKACRQEKETPRDKQKDETIADILAGGL